RRYIPEDTPLTQITTARVMEVVSAMKKSGMANGTINRKLSALSKVMKLAAELDIIPKRPVIKFLKEGEARDRVLTEEEEIKAILFFEHLGAKASLALFKFLLYTGCRVGEAYKLRREDVK